MRADVITAESSQRVILNNWEPAAVGQTPTGLYVLGRKTQGRAASEESTQWSLRIVCHGEHDGIVGRWMWWREGRGEG